MEALVAVTGQENISGHFDSSKIANRRYRKQEKIDGRGKEHSSSSFSGLF